MSTVIFIGFIVFSLYLAFSSRKGGDHQSVQDFFIASRQFGTFLVFFLAAGDIYSVGAMVGFPGGIYAKGPAYGIWYLGYILLAYPVCYFIGPKIWQAGKRYNAITLPDLFKGHYGSRALELIVAISAVLFMLPWGQLQFTGLVAAFRGLGWNFEPLHLIMLAAALAFAYILMGGIRASARVSILKDILMVAAIIITGLAVAGKVGVGEVFHAASLHSGNGMNGQQLRFSMSTILFQSLGLCVMPFCAQNFFTAKSANTIRKTQLFMPLYMLMYPFLVIASCYAISQNLKLASPNEAYFSAVTLLLPDWLLGLVAAGAALAGLTVLACICLTIGSIVTRNLLPNMPENRQKVGGKVVIFIYLLLSIAMTLLTPDLMLTLINTTYYGITQFFPGVIVIVFALKVRPAAVGLGLLAGECLAVALYIEHVNLNGLNTGLLSLVINVAIVAVVNYASKLMAKVVVQP